MLILSFLLFPSLSPLSLSLSQTHTQFLSLSPFKKTVILSFFLSMQKALRTTTHFFSFSELFHVSERKRERERDYAPSSYYLSLRHILNSAHLHLQPWSANLPKLKWVTVASWCLSGLEGPIPSLWICMHQEKIISIENKPG